MSQVQVEFTIREPWSWRDVVKSYLELRGYPSYSILGLDIGDGLAIIAPSGMGEIFIEYDRTKFRRLKRMPERWEPIDLIGRLVYPQPTAEIAQDRVELEAIMYYLAAYRSKR